jgi:hypothetical protein
MRHASVIGFLVSVVLAPGGCGRPRALSVGGGTVGDTGERPVVDSTDAGAGSDVPDANAPLDALANLDMSSAPEAGAPFGASGATHVMTAPDAGTDVPALPADQYRALAISVGRLHACAILDDHRVKCWGNNLEGELGLGDRMNRGSDSTTMGDALPVVDLGTGRTAKAIATGMYTTCATLDDDTLKCWGAVPPIDPTGNVGDAPGEMGDHLKPIDLGAGRKPVAVAIGWSETCVALDDKSFLCWGSSTTAVAAASDGARVVQFTRDFRTLGVFDDGSVRRIDLLSPSGPKPVVGFGGQPPGFMAGPAASVAGAANLGGVDCVILRAGGTTCTGPEFYAVPPVPPDTSVVALALTEYGHACGLDSAGEVTCWDIQEHPEWGDDANGSTVRVPLGRPATAVGAGDYNACALLADGTVKCWAIDGTYAPSLGGSVSTSTGWATVDLGTRPLP